MPFIFTCARSLFPSLELQVQAISEPLMYILGKNSELQKVTDVGHIKWPRDGDSWWRYTAMWETEWSVMSFLVYFEGPLVFFNMIQTGPKSLETIYEGLRNADIS